MQSQGSSSSHRAELWSTAQERRRYEDLADLYAILRTTEFLELAHNRDCIESQSEYEEQCQKLINQFKATEKALLQSGQMESLEQFLLQFQVVDCPRALERIRIGAPQGSAAGTQNAASNSKSTIQAVKDLTELFIYCSNLISLNHRAVDELLPQLEALVKTIDKAKLLLGVSLPGNEELALQQWVKRMQAMRASDEIDEEQARQLLFDLNTCKAGTDDMLT